MRPSVRGAKLIVARAHDRVIASDPGLVRLRLGARAAGTALLAAALLRALVAVRGLPSTLVFLGAAIGVISSISVTDARARDQLVTTVLSAPVACGSLGLGALLARHPLLAPAAMIAGTFVVVAVRAFGPRGTALGMVGFFAYFFSLYFASPGAVVLDQLVAVLVGVSSAAVMRFVVIREHPERVAKNTLNAFECRARLLLDLVARWLRSEGTSRALRARLARALERFEETALELEDRLERTTHPPGLRASVTAVELSVERIAEAARNRKVQGRERASRLALADTIDALSAAARGLEPYQGDDPRVLSVLEKVGTVRARLVEGSETTVATPSLPPEPAAPTRLYLRQALQATLAGLLSYVVGHAVSATRWSWAVLASLVVFNRSTTAGDTLLRALHRVIGTTLGVVAGASLAIVLARHPHAQLGLMFVCVFLGYYFMRVSYAWAMAWMTALVALLYGVLGRFETGVMLVRLEETIVGAGFGAIAAMLILPARATDRARERAASILHEAAARLRGEEAAPRTLERQVQRLREEVRPARRSPLVRARSTAEVARHVASLVYSLRHLVGLHYGDRARAILAAQSRAAESLAQALEGREHVEVRRSGRAIERARLHARGVDERRALHWIARIEAAIDALAGELAPAHDEPRTPSWRPTLV